MDLFRREDLARAFREQPAGEPAGAGADFEHVTFGKIASGTRDASGEVKIEQKVLPQGFFGGDLVCVYHLAQRGEAVDLAHVDRAFAIWWAMRTAAIIEVGSAIS